MNDSGPIYFGSLEDEMEINDATDTTEIVMNDNYKPQILNQNNIQSHQNDEFERRALARTLRIPTDDLTVRQLLIKLNQPITIFGEGPAERRDRLRLMASRAIFSLPKAFELFPFLKNLLEDTTTSFEDENDSGDDDDEEFYVPGSVDLIKIRSFLLEDSISRSRNRLSIDHVKENSFRSNLYEKLSNNLDLKASFIDCNGRPLSVCTFTENGDFYTGSWGGRIMKYRKDNDFRGEDVSPHNRDRITSICSDNLNGILIGTASGKIEYNDHVLSLPTTHVIKSLNWHPSNKFFSSSSSDSIWRLWDSQLGTELQAQEGHLGGIGAGTWHPDGSIYCTAGSSDGVIRFWDCRLGKSIWNVNSKGSSIVSFTSLEFSPLTPNVLASANTDGIISLHDLRKLDAEYMKVAAHRSCCSNIKFMASNGRVLASSGFDGSLRLWCPGDLRLVKEISVSPTAKVTDFDVWNGPDDSIKLAAVTFDRIVKIFS